MAGLEKHRSENVCEPDGAQMTSVWKPLSAESVLWVYTTEQQGQFPLGGVRRSQPRSTGLTGQNQIRQQGIGYRSAFCKSSKTVGWGGEGEDVRRDGMEEG